MNQSALPKNPPLDQLVNPNALLEFDDCLGVILAIEDCPRPVESISRNGIAKKVPSLVSEFRVEKIW